MWYQFKSYLKFLLRSTSWRNIHSPFMYDLLTQCIYNNEQYSEYTQLKSIRNSLRNDDRIVKVDDFGEGSRIFKTNKRTVSRIAKIAGMPLKRQKLLYRLTKYIGPKNVLELGTSLGLSTSAIALAVPDAKLVTVEGCRNTASIAQEYFDKHGFKNIELVKSGFDDFLEKQGKDPEDLSMDRYDMIFIDGNHNEEDTLRYFNAILPLIHEDSVVIFDDIYWSRAMTRAWNRILGHPKVIMSMDIYYWGIVFLKPLFKNALEDQQKQHFSIRL